MPNLCYPREQLKSLFIIMADEAYDEPGLLPDFGQLFESIQSVKGEALEINANLIKAALKCFVYGIHNDDNVYYGIGGNAWVGEDLAIFIGNGRYWAINCDYDQEDHLQCHLVDLFK